MKRARFALAMAFALLALSFAGTHAAAMGGTTGSSIDAAAPAASQVFVSIQEMSIHTIAVARAGTVTFTVKNNGTTTHELVVLRTDLPEDQLPANTSEPGKVQELGWLGESGDLDPGTSADFTLTLTPGHYVLICNEPGHYAAGMHATLIVASHVGVSLQEMSIKADATSIPAGPVIFDVTNAGTVTHELVVLHTDIAQDKLPASVDEPGKVQEIGWLGETDDIDAGHASSVLLTLGPGNYVLICNEPGHYAGGMHIAFTVK